MGFVTCSFASSRQCLGCWAQSGFYFHEWMRNGGHPKKLLFGLMCRMAFWFLTYSVFTAICNVETLHCIHSSRVGACSLDRSFQWGLVLFHNKQLEFQSKCELGSMQLHTLLNRCDPTKSVSCHDFRKRHLSRVGDHQKQLASTQSEYGCPKMNWSHPWWTWCHSALDSSSLSKALCHLWKTSINQCSSPKSHPTKTKVKSYATPTKTRAKRASQCQFALHRT